MQNCVHAEYIHSPGSLGLNLFLGGGHTKHQKESGSAVLFGQPTKIKQTQKEKRKRIDERGVSIFINSWLPQCSACRYSSPF